MMVCHAIVCVLSYSCTQHAWLSNVTYISLFQFIIWRGWWHCLHSWPRQCLWCSSSDSSISLYSRAQQQASTQALCGDCAVVSLGYWHVFVKWNGQTLESLGHQFPEGCCHQDFVFYIVLMKDSPWSIALTGFLSWQISHLPLMGLILLESSEQSTLIGKSSTDSYAALMTTPKLGQFLAFQIF